MSNKSTMDVTEHVIITERKRHPNDVRYPCRGSHEVLDAGRKLITFLHNDNPAQLEELKEGKLILDEEETAELYDSFQEKDVIGLGMFRPTGHPNSGFTSNMYTIEKIVEGEDYMECRNMRSSEIEEISFQDVSIALALGLAEILYRDDKPFGISNEQEWKILIPNEVDEAEKDESATPATQTSSPTPASPDKQVEPKAVSSAGDMFGDLGLPSLSERSVTESSDEANKETESTVEVASETSLATEEAEDSLQEKLNPRYFSKRRKLSYLQMETFEVGDIVWVHATTNLGQVMAKGPVSVVSIDENIHTFTDALGKEFEINLVEDWDDYAEHFKAGGGFYNFYEARDSRPKPESEASANDDSDKLIKALGLDKKAKADQEKLEKQEIPVRWNECYFAFHWKDGTYCLVVCSKKHWDENGTIGGGEKIRHLAEQVNLKELEECVYEYSETYNETSLRTLFKAFGCEENKDMTDNL